MMAQIIQKELTLHTRINEQCMTSGMDHFWDCRDKLHYLKYPYKVEYNFNSRGFRDDEWPESAEELRDAIWCVGDSFTVGLGSPIDHTWPNMLAQATGKRTINVSMDGASNNWMARQIEYIEKKYSPKNIIVMWSYWHRREDKNELLLDEDRRMHDQRTQHSSYFDDLQNFLDNKIKVESIVKNNLIHLSIPDTKCYYEINNTWKKLRGNGWPCSPPTDLDAFNALPELIRKELMEYGATDLINYYCSSLHSLPNWQKDRLQQDMPIINRIPQLDWARDGHHFDKKTSRWVVDQIFDRLI
jgi:hypothetical protein